MQTKKKEKGRTKINISKKMPNMQYSLQDCV